VRLRAGKLACVAGVNGEGKGERERGRKMGDWGLGLPVPHFSSAFLLPFPLLRLNDRVQESKLRQKNQPAKEIESLNSLTREQDRRQVRMRLGWKSNTREATTVKEGDHYQQLGTDPYIKTIPNDNV